MPHTPSPALPRRTTRRTSASPHPSLALTATRCAPHFLLPRKWAVDALGHVCCVYGCARADVALILVQGRVIGSTGQVADQLMLQEAVQQAVLGRSVNTVLLQNGLEGII